jgi:hypothetical protein
VISWRGKERQGLSENSGFTGVFEGDLKKRASGTELIFWKVFSLNANFEKQFIWDRLYNNALKAIQQCSVARDAFLLQG